MEKTSSSPLIHTLLVDKDALTQELASRQFYIEWIIIGIAVALSWLISLLVQRHIAARLQDKPLKFIDSEFVTRPLKLLAPLLAMLYLAIGKPFVVNIGGGIWLQAMLQLSGAYLIAKAILLMVRSRPVAWFLAGTVMLAAALDATGLVQPVHEYLESVAFSVGKYEITLLGLARGLVILVVVFWAAGILSNTLESYLRRSSAMSYNARELSVKFFRIFLYVIAFMITLSAVGVDLTALAVFGGALGVGIGLGLQRITANFVSGITLLLEKSIQIGDLVEIDTVSGYVRQLNIRYTLIESFDGRDVMIPNEEMTTKPVINWTHTTNRARVEVKASVAYGTDPKLVRKLMLDAAQEHPKCLRDPEPACWLREFADSGLNFMMVFWIADVTDGRYGPQSEVMMTILEKFDAHGIEIPFPQLVLRRAVSDDKESERRA